MVGDRPEFGLIIDRMDCDRRLIGSGRVPVSKVDDDNHSDDDGDDDIGRNRPQKTAAGKLQNVVGRGNVGDRRKSICRRTAVTSVVGTTAEGSHRWRSLTATVIETGSIAGTAASQSALIAWPAGLQSVGNPTQPLSVGGLNRRSDVVGVKW